MELQEVEVIIGKNGQVQISVSGVSGLACLDITAPIEAALGGEIIAREMHENGVQAQQTVTTAAKTRVRRKR